MEPLFINLPARFYTKIILVFIFLYILSVSFAQQRFQVNYGIDTSNAENKAILKKWKSYISYNSDFITREEQHKFEDFWSKSTIEQYTYPDLLNYCGALNPSLLGLGLNNKVIAISKKNDFYLLKSIFYYTETDSSFVTIAITNYPLKKENETYSFYNALHLNTAKWKEKRVGQIVYHYNPRHKFNKKTANQANEAYLNLTSLFDIKSPVLNYYIYESCDDLYNTIGFDFRIGMGGENNRCGYYDGKNNIVHTGGYENPEFHEHELIHIINNSFTNAHEWFLAGISGYWGGHFGKNLKYHIDRVYNRFKKDNSVNFNNILEYEQLDDFTNPTYVFGGILCHLALEKKGLNGLKRLLNYGKTEQDFYMAIEKELGIPRDHLHTEMMRLLKEYSSDTIPTISYKSLLKK